MNNPITRWWLALPSATQYMYWIIAFCAMLASGIALIVGLEHFGMMQTLLLPVLLCIGAFVLFFMFIVLWFTFVWPDERGRE